MLNYLKLKQVLLPNILNGGEFTEDNTIGISNISSGERKSKIYNLDMIIVVGYWQNFFE